MRIHFDNCDFSSSSGPNSFALKLARSLSFRGHTLDDGPTADVQLSFIMRTKRVAPVVLRLDGIYFNSEQDYEALNLPIKQSYWASQACVVQSEFDRELITHYFGRHTPMTVIRNGTDLNEIESIAPLSLAQLDEYEHVWCCASSWRPHKRLSENVRYFLEVAPTSDCLVIAGENPDVQVAHPRVFYAGHLNRESLIALFKRSKYFIHLACMDHCANVVVDSRAAGCRIVCASSGGTHEIAGSDAIVVKDMDWDFKPFRLYDPPPLDFSVTCLPSSDVSYDIEVASIEYERVLQSVTCEHER